MRISPLSAPDGMRMGGAEHVADERMRRLMGIVLPQERDDDGLVHNHNWASGMPPVGRGTPDSPVRKMMDVVLPHERHDDGLVHSHSWAASNQ